MTRVIFKNATKYVRQKLLPAAFKQYEDEDLSRIAEAAQKVYITTKQKIHTSIRG